MVKHTQTIRQQKPTNCLSVFDHFWGLPVKGMEVGYLKSYQIFMMETFCKNSLSKRVLQNLSKKLHPRRLKGPVLYYQGSKSCCTNLTLKLAYPAGEANKKKIQR